MDLVSKTSRKASLESANALERNVDSVLAELIDQLPGVSAAMLFDADGFALSGVIRPGGTLEPEAAEAAAMGASLIGAARRALAAEAGAEADAPVRSIWVRNDRQNLYCVEVGEAAYAVVTAEPDVPAGLLIFRIDKWSKLAAQTIDSLSLTIPEQLAGSDPSRTDHKLIAVEVPADRIGPVRVGVPDDIADRDADQVEPFEPYVGDEDAVAEDRGALYAHGAGLIESGLVESGLLEKDRALDDESFDLAEAIGSELVAEAEAEFEAELLAAEPAESVWAAPLDLPAPVDIAAPLDLPAPPDLSWEPESSDLTTDDAADPIAVVFTRTDLAADRSPVAPRLSDDWVITETAAAPAAPAPAAFAAAPAPAPAPMALADAMGDWMAPAAPAAPAPAASAAVAAPAPAPATTSAFSRGQARPPQGGPVSFDAPPPGFAPVPPAWMAPAPVAARAPMVAPPSSAARPMALAPPAWQTAPAPTGRPVTFGAPLAAAQAAARPAWNAPAPTGSPIMVAPPPPMTAPVSFDPPPVVFGGQPATSPNAYRPMAPRPATAVWSPAAPDELELDRRDLPSWGAYSNPNSNAERP